MNTVVCLIKVIKAQGAIVRSSDSDSISIPDQSPSIQFQFQFLRFNSNENPWNSDSGSNSGIGIAHHWLGRILCHRVKAELSNGGFGLKIGQFLRKPSLFWSLCTVWWVPQTIGAHLLGGAPLIGISLILRFTMISCLSTTDLVAFQLHLASTPRQPPDD